MAMIMKAPLKDDWKSIQNEATTRSRDTNISEIRNEEFSVVNKKKCFELIVLKTCTI